MLVFDLASPENIAHGDTHVASLDIRAFLKSLGNPHYLQLNRAKFRKADNLCSIFTRMRNAAPNNTAKPLSINAIKKSLATFSLAASAALTTEHLFPENL